MCNKVFFRFKAAIKMICFSRVCIMEQRQDTKTNKNSNR